MFGHQNWISVICPMTHCSLPLLLDWWADWVTSTPAGW